ncbi:MAG: hypothetical protein IJQ42_10480 [Oscillospiraceae bacterium]|nr:hypothetical protein [Oscillospiraceae bacterium]
MKKTGSTILRYLIAIVLVGVAGFLVTTGFRFLNAHNAMQKEAKIALEDYLSSGRELPVDEFVSYEARWVIGPFATETETQSTNGITATSGVNSYYYLILDEPDGLSLMALESENAQENETLERMSDWLLSVDGYPYEGETLKVQGKLEEMKDTELRRYFSEDLQEIFGISPNDPAVRYLVLDTTEGREGIYLILAAAAVALLLIVVIIKKAKKKAPAPVAAAPAGEDTPRPYDPEIR